MAKVYGKVSMGYTYTRITKVWLLASAPCVGRHPLEINSHKYWKACNLMQEYWAHLQDSSICNEFSPKTVPFQTAVWERQVIISVANNLPMANVTGSDGGPIRGPFLRYITTWYWAPGTRFSIIGLLEFTLNQTSKKIYVDLGFQGGTERLYKVARV